MSDALQPNPALQHCLELAQELTHHNQANQSFEALRSQIALDNPEVAILLSQVWRELISAQRSAAFWQQICNVERDLTEKMTASHVQLQQNYLRLMQEQ
jgi:hypothetical protein